MLDEWRTCNLISTELVEYNGKFFLPCAAEGQSVEVDVPLGEAAAFHQPADLVAVFRVRVKPEVDGGVDDQVGGITSVHSGRKEWR